MQAIANNLLSQFSNRQLNITTGKKAKSAEKLSTGYKINRSADDAAGLQISEKMRWQIRGLDKASNNVEEGVSLLQVADGALNEVHDLLQRMNELVIQAANDTNTQEDRDAIQKEISKLIEEIDRIGDDTEFNTKKIFQGGYTTMLDPSGNPIPISNIPVSDFELSRTELDGEPFMAGSAGYYLNLGASTVDGYTQTSWDLLFGSGTTSQSSLRFRYEDDNGNVVTQSKGLSNMSLSGYNYNNGTDTYSRIYSYDAGDGVSFEIEQMVNIGANNGTEQYYDISYSVRNTGTRDVEIDFMFNADTAYNNNDHCEGYFIGGNKVNNFCVYTSNDEYKNQGSSYIYDISALNTAKGFSIIDEDNALPFAEKVKWDTADMPDTVSIGHWPSNTWNWDYYDNLSQKLGQNTDNSDIAFSLIWNRDITAGAMQNFNFQYGIMKADTDSNLSGVPINYNTSTQVHVNQLDLWIQSGATNGNGMFITIGEMNSGELGIRGVDVGNFDRASIAIEAVGRAIDKVSAQRSFVGAQQNRLEYAKLVDNNTQENTQAAESRIRDTDMAKEMVKHSKYSILQQAGQSMLAQANQSKQGILSLLQ